VRPSTSSGALGSLFGGKKRETNIFDQPLQASPPSIHTGEQTRSTTSLRSAVAPKRIITTLPATPPNLVDAPTTLVTPPTPTDGNGSSPTHSTHSKDGKHTSSQSNPNVKVSPSGNMISHRRVRSATNPPSKLSNSITAPLTPHPEEAKTPGGTAFAPQNPGGFFASVFSAAQNAANNLSNTIANNNTNKTKPGQQQQAQEENGADGGEEVIGPENADTTADSASEQRRPAVETLGSGNLSLAHLGIVENEVSPMSSTTNVAMKADEASAKAEDIAATLQTSPLLLGTIVHDPSRPIPEDQHQALHLPNGKLRLPIRRLLRRCIGKVASAVASVGEGEEDTEEAPSQLVILLLLP
jgi:hypothetical protein